MPVNPMRLPLSKSFLSTWAWLVPALIGGGITVLTLFVLPPERTLYDLTDFVFKISPLVLAVLTIALFPQHGRWLPGLLLLGFIFYMGFVDSAFVIEISALVDDPETHFSSFYTFNLFVNSFTILLALFAYRLGGGSTSNVLRLGLAAILVMVSGLNDLTFWMMYSWPEGTRPFLFDWASHVAVFIGRTPTLYDMIGFLAVHLLLAGLIILLPFRRLFARLRLQISRRPAQVGAKG